MSEGPETAGPDDAVPESGEQRAMRLERQLAAVAARVFHLEQEVAAMRSASLAAAATSPRVPSVPADVAAQLPGPVPTARPPAAGQRSLESRVGSQWFNRIGIIALLVGVAWFLKFAFDNHWVGPLGRVLIGLLSGAALVAWSERFRSKGYAAFSYSLKALGSGVLYLSLWAAFSLYQLILPGVAFAGMVVVTVFNAFIAWRQDTELLAVYAIVGAFSTPLLLATGHNDEIFLFSYLLLMNAATVALLVLKGWNRLLVLSFIGTVSFYWGWYFVFYKPVAFATTATFLVLFVLLFAAATVLARQKRLHAAQDDAVRALVSLANAAFGFLGFYALLSREGSVQYITLAWCAVAFAAFYLGIRKVMERTPIAGTRLASLSDVQLSIAIVFLTLAVPLAVHGPWITVGWMAEGTVLVWLATRMRTTLMRVLALGALVLGLISLAGDATVAQKQVLWNMRMLSFAAGIAAMSCSALLVRRAAARAATNGDAAWWKMLAVGCAVAAHVLVVVAGLLEIGTFWATRPLAVMPTSPMYGQVLRGQQMAEQFSYSSWLLLAGVALLAVGFRRHAALLRWEGLALLAVTIVKVFLVDTSRLSQGYRIVSFLALGVLLLGVSFAYQRDWLHLRAVTDGGETK